MGNERISSFAEFWPYYVGEHRDSRCRGLHYLGTSFGIGVAAVMVVTRTWWLFPVGLFFGYGPAWIGHFFIEHNRPATFRYPLWSLLSDFKMLGLAARGKMASEVTRLYGSAGTGTGTGTER